MIPNYTNKTTECGGTILGSMDYRVEARNLRHLVKLIRDSVYEDKELAPLREYATNALDAHTEFGNPEVPIRIVLPTLFEPTLKIRDFGPGLTPDEIRDVYISIGESTKRETNKQIGSMGLGSKSGFAYGDSFIVTSWKGGVKTVYNNVLDDSIESGCRCDILSRQGCGNDEHGIEITIPIRNEDIGVFPNKALQLFKYWDVFPDIENLDDNLKNSTLEEYNKPSILSGDNWVIKPKTNRYSSGESVVIMGNIPYPIKWNILEDKMSFKTSNDRVIFRFLKSNSVVFKVQNGDLDFDVSREGLQYTDKTVGCLSRMVEEISSSIFDIVNNRVSKANNIWEAMGIYGSIFDGSNWTVRESKSETGESGESDDLGFSGELSEIKGYFADKLMWNGNKISSGFFDGINLWDFENGKHSSSYDVSSPIMETYWIAGSTIKTRRTSSRKGNQIIPSRKSMVVVNVGATRGFRMACKYLLNHENPGGIVRVYLLNFKDEAKKEEFYKHYNFYTVPVMDAAKLIVKAKAFAKANKVASGASSTGGYTYTPQETAYIDVLNPQRYSQWSYTAVDTRNESGYYVRRETGRNSRSYISLGYDTINIGDLSKAIGVISEHLELGIDKIYGLTDRTLKAKWFDGSVANGQWQNVIDYIKSEMKDAITDDMKRSFAYLKASTDDCHRIGVQFIKKLRGRITDPDSPVNKLVESMDGVTEYANLYKALLEIGLEIPTDCGVNFRKLMSDVDKAYPLLWSLDHADTVMKTEDRDSYYKFSKSTIDEIVEYINYKDSQRVVEESASAAA